MKTAAKSILRDWSKPVIVALVMLAALLVSGFRTVTVQGASMDSTLESGERIVVTNFMYTPQNGDIVVISKGAHYDEPIIKRVIAVGGQTLQLDYEHDRIYVDGREVEEPYLSCSTFGGKHADYAVPTVIPEGKLFVMGDNRSVSLDSRSETIGLVNASDVIGKAQFAVFPFDRIGGLDNN